MDDDLHISRIMTAWSMVREAHGDHTAVQSAQQRLLDRYGGAVRRYALSALRTEAALIPRARQSMARRRTAPSAWLAAVALAVEMPSA